MKKIICFLMLICMSMCVFAADFSDVPKNSEYYDAISYLSGEGIIKGYPDGTFGPEKSITRAEAAMVVARIFKYKDYSKQTLYRDVPLDHWANKEIATLTWEGITGGTGDGYFHPDLPVRHNEIIKMLACAKFLQNEAMMLGGWPVGFILASYENGYLSDQQYNFALTNGNEEASRGEVAEYVYRFQNPQQKDVEGVVVGGKKYYLGMRVRELDRPSDMCESTAGFGWYVYGTYDYENFVALGVDGDKVVAIAATGKGFEYKGLKAGDTLENYQGEKVFYTDSNDGGIIHSVLIMDKKYGHGKVPTINELADEGIMNFHFTNAFRVYHKLKPLKWDVKAAMSARLHSEDMAKNNYFNHSSQDGTTPFERMEKQKISYSKASENIAAGNMRYLGFHSFDGWVNSAGHRQNMLGDFEYLGVGIAHNPDSTYEYYHTQNFFTPK